MSLISRFIDNFIFLQAIFRGGVPTTMSLHSLAESATFLPTFRKVVDGLLKNLNTYRNAETGTKFNATSCVAARVGAGLRIDGVNGWPQ